jgi:hypothetical protein
MLRQLEDAKMKPKKHQINPAFDGLLSAGCDGVNQQAYPASRPETK